MEFIKVDKSKVDELGVDIDINGNVDIYFLKDSDILLGYGFINKSIENNIIYIYVYEEFRGNGYGSRLFKYLYDELKREGIEEVVFTIDNSNTRFISIITKYDNIHLGINNGLVTYVVFIK